MVEPLPKEEAEELPLAPNPPVEINDKEFSHPEVLKVQEDPVKEAPLNKLEMQPLVGVTNTPSRPKSFNPLQIDKLGKGIDLNWRLIQQMAAILTNYLVMAPAPLTNPLERDRQTHAPNSHRWD